MYSKSQATISRILEVARRLFIDRHYADVTMLEIAAAAEVSKGALYHHFPGKEAVYLQMMHHHLREIQSVTMAAIINSSGCCRERLRQSILSFLQMPDELHGVLRLVRRDINLFKDPMRRDLIRAYQTAVPEQVERIIHAGIDNGEIQSGDARLLSWEIVALVEAALRPYSRQVLGHPVAMADFVVGLFCDGVGVRAAVDNTAS